MTESSVSHQTTEQKALELWERRGHLVRSTGSDTYLAPSGERAGRRYRVEYGGESESCDCPAFVYAKDGSACKHLVLVAIWVAKGSARKRVISPAGDPFQASGISSRDDNLDRYRHELLDSDERLDLGRELGVL